MTKTTSPEATKFLQEQDALNTNPGTAPAIPPLADTNPLNIDWPLDRNGALSAFKREAVRTVERINGHEEKAEDFLATLRVFAKWAQARIADQKDRRAGFRPGVPSGTEAADRASDGVQRRSVAPNDTAGAPTTGGA